ncbi:MAG: hypothetical protein ABJJ72_13070, partial [Anderseniella sp.]
GKARAFAGCRIGRRSAEFIIGREGERINEARVQIEPGQCVAEWDRRYHVSNCRGADRVELAVLRDVDEQLLPDRPKTVPDFVWQGLPVAISEGNQVIIPGEGRQPGSQGQQNVVFHLIAGPKTAQT